MGVRTELVAQRRPRRGVRRAQVYALRLGLRRQSRGPHPGATAIWPTNDDTRLAGRLARWLPCRGARVRDHVSENCSVAHRPKSCASGSFGSPSKRSPPCANRGSSSRRARSRRLSKQTGSCGIQPPRGFIQACSAAASALSARSPGSHIGRASRSIQFFSNGRLPGSACFRFRPTNVDNERRLGSRCVTKLRRIRVYLARLVGRARGRHGRRAHQNRPHRRNSVVRS